MSNQEYLDRASLVALNGYLIGDSDDTWDVVVRDAWRYAQAMLIERERVMKLTPLNPATNASKDSA